MDGTPSRPPRRIFPNAPITEAVLDIQVSLGPGVPLQQLATIHDGIRADYPKRRERKRWEGTLAFGGPEEEVNIRQRFPKVDGYLFISADEKQIVQARLDGFTFNRLKPYERWEALRDEARRHWGRYVHAVQPTAVKRISLRYINRLELPLPVADFKQYIRTVPELAPGIPQGVSGFFMRLEVPYPNGIVAIITETIQPPEGERILPFIFDIDVIEQREMDPNSEEIWVRFEALHDAKNDVFFNSITSSAEELFQ